MSKWDEIQEPPDTLEGNLEAAQNHLLRARELNQKSRIIEDHITDALGKIGAARFAFNEQKEDA